MNKTFLLIFCAALLFLFAFTSQTGSKNFSPYSNDTLIGPVFHAKDHKGKSVVSTSGVISLTTGLHNDYYQLDSNNKLGYLYVETMLDKFSNTNAKRIPLNISIVIDRSGSMEGIKMGYAKKAAKGIIDQLRSEDIVSVVMYDTYVDTVQSPTNVIDKEKIKSRIDKIIPRASTNLWGGADQGYQYVLKNYKPGSINRVLLISDGLANTGITDSSIIHTKVQNYKDENGISISTFGVGLDYNETLMTDMAETGAGNYYFIDAPDKLTSIFSNELNGLLNVAAQNAELRIRLPHGIKIIKGYPLEFQQKGDELILKLRDLSSQETRAVVFTFSIDNKLNESLKFTSTLSYTDVTNGQQKTISNENLLSPIKKVEPYLTHFNKQVVEQTILYNANERLELAMNLLQKGDINKARALILQNNNYLRQNGFYVKDQRELMRMDSINNSYGLFASQSLSVNADSTKKLQKSNKAENYKIRTKKQ